MGDTSGAGMRSIRVYSCDEGGVNRNREGHVGWKTNWIGIPALRGHQDIQPEISNGQWRKQPSSLAEVNVEDRATLNLVFFLFFKKSNSKTFF